MIQTKLNKFTWYNSALIISWPRNQQAPVLLSR